MGDITVDVGMQIVREVLGEYVADFRLVGSRSIFFTYNCRYLDYPTLDELSSRLRTRVITLHPLSLDSYGVMVTL